MANKRFYYVMKVLIALLAFAAAGCAQSGHVFTVIPDSTRATVGRVDFLDKQAAPHKVSFQAPATLAADIVFTLPPALAAGCWVSTALGVTTIDPTCLGSTAIWKRVGTVISSVNAADSIQPNGLEDIGATSNFFNNAYLTQTLTQNVHILEGAFLSYFNLGINGTDHKLYLTATAGINVMKFSPISIGALQNVEMFGTALRFYPTSAGTGNTVGFKAPASGVTSSFDWALPPTDAVGFFQSDGAGNMSIASTSGLMTLSTAQTVTGVKTFAANILASGASVDIGSTVNPFNNSYNNQTITQNVRIIEGSLLASYNIGINPSDNLLYLTGTAGVNIMTFTGVYMGAIANIDMLGSALHFYPSSSHTGNNVGFAAPSSVTTTALWRLPPADAAGFWKSDGAGNLSISTVSYVSDPGANGLMSRTALNTTVARTLTGGGPITVSNGDGVSGNPTLACGQCAVLNLANTFSSTNIFQGGVTFQGTATHQANILASGTPDLGSTTNFFNNAYLTQTVTQNVHIIEGAFLSYFNFGINASDHLLYLTSTAGVNVMTFSPSYVGGLVNLDMLASAIHFYPTSSHTGNNVGFAAPSTVTTTALWRLPPTDAAGFFKSDGSGNMSIGAAVTSVGASGPIGSSGGATPTISCSTCLTTAGGQTISSAETFNGGITISTSTNSTLYTGSSGNFYTRPIAGSGISCSGVADGWLSMDTSGNNLLACMGGARYKVLMTAY